MRDLHRAGDRTRTGDVQLGKLAFYQLNYARKVTGNLARRQYLNKPTERATPRPISGTRW